MKIVTFNIRYLWDGDGINSFIYRAGLILEKICEEQPDVIAFQEVTERIFDFMEKNLPEYYLLGHGRCSNYDGEGVFTAIRKESVQLISLDTRWLTNTPYKCSWLEGQSACPRTCVITTLREKTSGELFAVYNVHLDANGEKGDEIRRKELEILSNWVCKEQLNRKLPFFIMGDFNAYPKEVPIQYCNCEFEPQIIDVTRECPTSFHDFGKKGDSKDKIDYIYVNQEFAKNIKNVNLWVDNKDGIYLSDHYPISAEVFL